MDDELGPRRFFSYEPAGADDVDEPPVTHLMLRRHLYGGPFWSDEGGLFEEYEDWAPYGMTRETFDACMRWNAGTDDDQEKGRLLRRLRAELPPDLRVE